jgi:pimeloyl-ACP methyl ester carboxylesterase
MIRSRSQTGAAVPYVNRAGVRLYYEDAGSGRVVLLHTGGGGDGRMWKLAGYPAALAGYRLLLMDHRGHGRSDCPAGIAPHRMSEYVADVTAVLDDAGADRAALVGYSAGAEVIFAVSSRHPDRIVAVAGIGAVGAPDSGEGDVAAWVAAIRAEGMRAAMERIAAQEPQRPPDWLMDNLAETDAEMFALLVEAWAGEPGSWAAFPAIPAPALIICGENEEPDAARHAQLAARTLPHGSAAVLPGLSHLQAFWRTDLSCPPLTAFLSEHWASLA